MASSDNPENELRNKNETELPIGDPQAPAKRESVMWRCSDCGEMGRLAEELPETCPACDADREELYRWEED
ncbi:DUF7130 family rubredoxin-like protein [Halolamina rubra]|uniref:DUF7130 family rubredoxin-like protein n=1 Tax=Halolamina rubra TaxID=1380430 RepID=UPI0006796E9A|nr:hypothetical protein [Halolamina rubra]